MTKSRIASGLLALVYLALAVIFGGLEATLKCALFLLLPLACIWYADEMGSFTGTMRGQHIGSETPGCFVALGGWLILLLPVFLIFFKGCHG